MNCNCYEFRHCGSHFDECIDHYRYCAENCNYRLYEYVNVNDCVDGDEASLTTSYRCIH